MDRRHFLGAVSGAIAGLTAWLGGARLDPGPEAQASLSNRLVAVFRAPRSAAAVGRRFLDRHPEEAGAEPLATRIAADLRARGCDPLRADTAELRAALSRQIQADFDTARVVHVQGWLLSATEARLCGLAATIL